MGKGSKGLKLLLTKNIHTMKTREIKFTCLFFLSVIPFFLMAQNDSTNTYTYNCSGCGNYTLVASEPMDSIETTVNVSTETKPDTGIITVAVFSTTSSRKASEPAKIKEGKNYFKVFPNPAKENYFLYFETEEKCTGDLRFEDIYGRVIYTDKITLKKGMNVIEKSNMHYKGNNYFFTAVFNNKVFKQKILFVK
jgi:hypothetical protein